MDLLTGRRFRAAEAEGLPLADLLEDYPVALLVRDDRHGREGRGRFDVWAPSAESMALERGRPAGPDGASPTAAGGRPTGPGAPGRGRLRLRRRPSTAQDVGARRDVVPDPRSRRLPHGVHGRSRTFDPAAHAWSDDALDRPAAGRLGGLRAARRHVHPRGHPRRRHRPARPPEVDRRRPRRAAAGQRVQRRARLGLRRRRLVRRPRAVRRPGGVPALRRRLPRRGDSASSRTSSTTTSARRGTTCRCSAPTSPRRAPTPGATT